jgi:hypothetical protein
MLRNVKWTTDTTISGHASWNQVTGQVRAWLTVTGPGSTSAAVNLHYLDYLAHPAAEISGTFHGRTLAATMPAP